MLALIIEINDNKMNNDNNEKNVKAIPCVGL